MIISCGNCQKKYKVDDSRISGDVFRFKCHGCGSPIVVKKNVEQDKGAVQAESMPMILLSTDDADIRDYALDILKGTNVKVLTASDGNETVSAIKKYNPEVVILDVALPGFYSFSICEDIKCKKGIGNAGVILTSAAFNRKRYKRKPTTLFGADDYIEKYDIPVELIEKINRLKVIPELKAAPQVRAGGHADEGRVLDVKEAKAKESENNAVGKNAVPDRAADEKARKLAKVIAADIILYNRKKLEDSLTRNDIREVFKDEIEEGIRYFNQRLPFPVSAEPYLSKALEDYIHEVRKKEALG